MGKNKMNLSFTMDSTHFCSCDQVLNEMIVQEYFKTKKYASNCSEFCAALTGLIYLRKPDAWTPEQN